MSGWIEITFNYLDSTQSDKKVRKSEAINTKYNLNNYRPRLGNQARTTHFVEKPLPHYCVMCETFTQLNSKVKLNQIQNSKGLDTP